MSASAATMPPTEAEALHVWVLESQAELPHLKASMLEVVTQLRPSAKFTVGGIADKMILVASELAVHALTLGLPPTIVRLLTDGPCLILDIADHDPEVPPEFAGDTPPGGGGRGLRLAHKLALDVGWYVDDTTKHVWARFPFDDSAQPPVPDFR
ncbi:ATP-binding protein [Actinoplanes sp. NPDC051859]|uniref:ATP-binding protein n=1 Tax=Actinoplanes sp. NPDC051859 TaxID=3363909 RepID=UPI003793F528